MIQTPNGPVTIGSPVQYVNERGNVFAATLIAWIILGGDEHTTVTVRVWEPSGANYVVSGLKLSTADVVNEPNTWRPLPLPALGVAEFPVQQFVEAVTPIVEAAVEAIFEARVAKS